MKSKNKGKDKLLALYVEDIEKEYCIWDRVAAYGCNDPTWSDGLNLNLTRNHIIYLKGLIRGLCIGEGMRLPGVSFLPVPPVVDGMYMAPPVSEKQRMRIAKIKAHNAGKAVVYDRPVIDRQMMLF